MQYIETYNKVDFKAKFNKLLQKAEVAGDEMLKLLQDQNSVLRDIYDVDLKNYDLDRQRYKAEVIQKFKLDSTEMNLDTYNGHINGVEKLVTGTGQGVLNHQLYEDWKTHASGLLFFANHLRDELKSSENCIACSFFFKDNNVGQTKPKKKKKKALRKIFYDLLRQLPQLDSIQGKIDKLEKEEIQLNSKEIWDIIGTAGQDSTNGDIVIILDALDGSDHATRETLIETLRNFRSNFPNARVRFLMTTRPLEIIFREFTNESILNLDDDPGCRQSLQSDIAKVARKQLDDFAGRNGITSSKKRNHLFNVLEQHKGQTYLFIKLLFQYLKDLPRQFDPDWVHIFRTLPATVSESYRAFLNNQSGSKESRVDQTTHNHGNEICYQATIQLFQRLPGHGGS